MRERILKACFDLFARHGIRQTSVDDLVACAGVAKATFYSYIPSKDEAALAYLKHLYRGWASAIGTSVAARGEGPQALLGVLDAVEALCGKDSNGGPRASLVRVLAEFGAANPLGRASLELSAQLTAHIAELAEAAGLAQPEEFARDYRLLLDGVVLSFAEDGAHAMHDAGMLAESLIRYHAAPAIADPKTRLARSQPMSMPPRQPPAPLRPGACLFLYSPHPLGLQSLREMFEEAGFDVVGTAADPDDALRQILALRPEVCVLDAAPSLAGVSLCGQVRGAAPEIPCIVLAASHAPGLARASSAAGAHAFVLKDVFTAELLAAVAAALSPPPSGD